MEISKIEIDAAKRALFAPVRWRTVAQDVGRVGDGGLVRRHAICVDPFLGTN